MTAEPPSPLGGNDPLLGGQSADLDHIAAIVAELAGHSGRVHPSLVPPSRPVPRSLGATTVESLAAPSDEADRFGIVSLSQGANPSLLSADLLPLRKSGRDLPSMEPPSPAHVASGARHPEPPTGVPRYDPQAPGGGPPRFDGPWSLPFSAAGQHPPLASDGGYYFLPPEFLPPEPGADVAISREPMVRDDFPILRQKVNGHRLVWLDNAATTQKPAVVIDAEAEFYRRDNSNVHRGAHALAKRATDAYEAARAKVQKHIGAESAEEIVFVRGTTEGINLVAHTLGEQVVGEGDEVVVSHLDHHSNIVPWHMLCQRKRARLRVVPVDDNGDILLDAYAALLGPRTRIVALPQVANVLGTCVPIGPMAAMAHQQGAYVVVDGAQSVAHIPVNVRLLDVDFFAFSGHKLYAPTGIGALYGRRPLMEAIRPWQGGGSMIKDVTFERITYSPPPAKFEAGTGHIAGAVGLGAAIDYVRSHGIEAIAAHEQALIQYAVDALLTVPGLRLLGRPAMRIAALPFLLDGYEPVEIAQALDQRGIAVRAGHHCAQPIHRRFGLEASVRASLGIYSAYDDIDALVTALREFAGKKKTRAGVNIQPVCV